MYETILVEKEKHVGILTFNRPERLNAMNPQLKEEVFQALEELEADGEVRAVIMTGAGRAFSSGWDMKATDTDAEEMSFKEEEKLLNFSKPLIAAVNGYALGAGAQHALLADIIIASESAKFGFIGARVGGICSIAVWALAGVIGRNRASELLFTCDQISAQEAYRIGLVNKVVPDGQLMTAAREMAGKIMKCAPLSIMYEKKALRKSLFDTEMKCLLQEGIKVTRGSKDRQEAARAFAEKREPAFKGK